MTARPETREQWLLHDYTYWNCRATVECRGETLTCGALRRRAAPDDPCWRCGCADSVPSLAEEAAGYIEHMHPEEAAALRGFLKAKGTPIGSRAERTAGLSARFMAAVRDGCETYQQVGERIGVQRRQTLYDLGRNLQDAGLLVVEPHDGRASRLLDAAL